MKMATTLALMYLTILEAEMSIVGSIVNDRVVEAVLKRIATLRAQNRDNPEVTEVLDKLRTQIEGMYGDE